jgi:DNA-binding CsgD family transcriptional regulator
MAKPIGQITRGPYAVAIRALADVLQRRHSGSSKVEYRPRAHDQSGVYDPLLDAENWFGSRAEARTIAWWCRLKGQSEFVPGTPEIWRGLKRPLGPNPAIEVAFEDIAGPEPETWEALFAEKIRVRDELRRRFDSLTERNRQILMLAGAGHTNKEIAHTLAGKPVSEAHVERLRAQAMRQLGAVDRNDLRQKLADLDAL